VPQDLIASYQLGFAPDEWDFLSSRLKQFPADAVEQAGLIVRRQRGKGFYDRFRRRIMFPIMDTGGFRIRGAGQMLMKEPGRLSIDLIQQGKPLISRSQLRTGQLNAVAGGQLSHGFGKAEVLMLHQEGEHVAALAAAEAVKGLCLRKYGERGRFFAVEGTKAGEVRPGPLELDMLADHLHNIGSIANFFFFLL
jgi:DNA primase